MDPFQRLQLSCLQNLKNWKRFTTHYSVQAPFSMFATFDMPRDITFALLDVEYVFDSFDRHTAG